MSRYHICYECANCGGTMRDSETFVKCHARDASRETYLPVQRLAAEAGHEREVCERWRRYDG